MTTYFHGYREDPTCPSQFKKDLKRIDNAKMDFVKKMAYIANEISLQN